MEALSSDLSAEDDSELSSAGAGEDEDEALDEDLEDIVEDEAEAVGEVWIVLCHGPCTCHILLCF